MQSEHFWTLSRLSWLKWLLDLCLALSPSNIKQSLNFHWSTHFTTIKRFNIQDIAGTCLPTLMVFILLESILKNFDKSTCILRIVCSNILTSTFIKPSMAKIFLKKKSCWTTIVRILGLIGEGTNVFAANMKLVHNRFSWLSLDWVIQSTNRKGKCEFFVFWQWVAFLQKSSMCKKLGSFTSCTRLLLQVFVLNAPGYGYNPAVFSLCIFLYVWLNRCLCLWCQTNLLLFIKRKCMYLVALVIIALCTATSVLFLCLCVLVITFFFVFVSLYVLAQQMYVLVGPGYRFCTAASAAHKPCRTALTKTLSIKKMKTKKTWSK